MRNARAGRGGNTRNAVIKRICNYQNNFFRKEIKIKALEQIIKLLVDWQKTGLGILAGTTVLSSSPALPTVQATETKPNIIFFLVDDLGWTDINCRSSSPSDPNDTAAEEYDSTYYDTPSISLLRKEGIRFTDAYAACPLCTPTRASILTGKYPARHDMTNTSISVAYQNNKITPNFTEPSYVKNLDPNDETTFVMKLKTDGYQTCSIGKWHLYENPNDINLYGPERHGFEYNIAGSYAGGPVLSTNGYYRNSGWDSTVYTKLENPPSVFDGTDWDGDGIEEFGVGEDDDFDTLDYLTDALTYRALEFIDMSVATSQDPNHENFGKPFFLYMSHYGVHTPIEAKDGIHTTDNYVADFLPEPTTGEHRNSVYAAMTLSVDESLGLIRDRLEYLNIDDNTIIIFYSDNGAVEGGITDNYPLRCGKTFAFEGGVRVPLIIYWPGRTAVNATCDVPVTSPDFFPTILEIAGIESTDPDIDGESIVPLLDGDADDFARENDPCDPDDDEAIFWHVPHYRGSVPFSAVRQGSNKLIRFYESDDVLENGRSNGDEPLGYEALELYDLDPNISENDNLADGNSAKAASMERMLNKWLLSVDASMPKGVVRNIGLGEEWYTGIYWANTNPNRNPVIKNGDPIRSAIGDPCTVGGDTITVYMGKYNENINFSGKNIKVQSTDPDDWNVVAATVIDANDYTSAVAFDNGEDANSILAGFTIQNGSDGVDCTWAGPVIKNCIIKDNANCGVDSKASSWPVIKNNKITGNVIGIRSRDSVTTILNNLIYGNTTGVELAENTGNDYSKIYNNTIVSNSTNGIIKDAGTPSPTISNCIIWGSGTEDLDPNLTVIYSCYSGGSGNGNIGTDPLFADPNNGDFRLKSQAGRWVPNQSIWVYDAVTSPCIDAGDPNSDWSGEFWPDGGRINMGAYGGTAEASMSLNPVGNAADFNKDDVVDYEDFGWFIDSWQSQELLLAEDINRNNFVDMIDAALFAQEWLWEP